MEWYIKTTKVVIQISKDCTYSFFDNVKNDVVVLGTKVYNVTSDNVHYSVTVSELKGVGIIADKPCYSDGEADWAFNIKDVTEIEA
jgi:hypothetical protein